MIITVVSITTFFPMVLPFIIFKDPKKTPDLIMYLSKILPYSIMTMLVVYCLKDMNFFNKNHALPELIAVIITILIHLYKNNTLLSIITGTIIYMVCIQLIFV